MIQNVSTYTKRGDKAVIMDGIMEKLLENSFSHTLWPSYSNWILAPGPYYMATTDRTK